MSAREAEPAAGETLARYVGPNGVEIAVTDESATYGLANLFRVRLRVLGRIPGAWEPYEKRLERRGVRAEDLESTRRALLGGFESRSLPYLFSCRFPARFCAHLERTRTQVVRFPGAV